jgi:ACS family D-galactonate transporter-like MFS transporter
MFDSMAKFSSAIGVPVLGLILLHFGWRWNFAATGIVSLVYLALFCAYYKNPSQDARLSQEERNFIQDGGAQPEDAARRAAGAPFFYLLKQPKVLGLALGYGSYNYVFYLLLTWLPTYLSDTHHLDLKHSAFYTSAPWLCATVAELIVGGWLVDALIQRGWKAAGVRRTFLVTGMLLGLGIFGVAYADNIQSALLWITISITGLSIAAPVGWSMPSLIAPRESVGTVGGIMNLSNQIAAIAAPIVTGYVVTMTKSYSGAFVAAAIVLSIGIAGYVFLLGDMEPIAEPGTS